MVAGIVHGLRPAARRRPAVVRPRLQRHALHHQSAGREGLRRGGRDRRLSRPSPTPSSTPWRRSASRASTVRRRRRASGRPCRRPDEAPRARDRAQPPAHPRRAAAAPAGRRPGARGRQRLGRACRAFRRRPAAARLPAQRSRRRGAGQHRCLGRDERPCQRPAGDGARCRSAGLAGRAGRRRALLQHDPYRALDGGRRPGRGCGPHPAGPRPALSLRPLSAATAGTRRRATTPSTATSGSAIPAWGIRDLEAVAALAAAEGFAAPEVVEMPANNLSLIFRRS